MATAGEATSTDWIWLREALALVVAALGSMALAKERLTEWLAAGDVTWSCMSWKGHGPANMAEVIRRMSGAAGPPLRYHPGDPRFWRTKLKIDWEDNAAYAADGFGCTALGIKVSRADVQARLPAALGEHTGALQQARPEQKLQPKEWLAKACKEQPRQQNEALSAYASRLLALMREAPVTKVWSFATLRRRLYK